MRYSAHVFMDGSSSVKIHCVNVDGFLPATPLLCLVSFWVTIKLLNTQDLRLSGCPVYTRTCVIVLNKWSCMKQFNFGEFLWVLIIVKYLYVSTWDIMRLRLCDFMPSAIFI